MKNVTEKKYNFQFHIKDDTLLDYLSELPYIHIATNVVYGRVLDENKIMTQYENGHKYMWKVMCLHFQAVYRGA